LAAKPTVVLECVSAEPPLADQHDDLAADDAGKNRTPGQVSPPGALASVPDWLRYGAVAGGFASFIMCGLRSGLGFPSTRNK